MPRLICEKCKKDKKLFPLPEEQKLLTIQEEERIDAPVEFFESEPNIEGVKKIPSRPFITEDLNVLKMTTHDMTVVVRSKDSAFNLLE